MKDQKEGMYNEENPNVGHTTESAETGESRESPESNVRELNVGSENREAPAYSAEDIEKNKAIAALAYLIFFLPLIAAQDSSYARFHGNQGLLLFILAFGGNAILTIIPILGWILIPFFSLFVIILAVIGILNAVNGKAKDLPLIGQFRILK